MGLVPIYCGFSDLVFGAGFVAHVDVQGRVLAEEEEDGWWVFGVTPSGVAGGGRTVARAVADFRQRLKLVLFDLAQESANFENFKAHVVEFFSETNETAEQDWVAARKAVREGKIGEGLALRKETKESRGNVKVTNLDLTPSANAQRKPPRADRLAA